MMFRARTVPLTSLGFFALSTLSALFVTAPARAADGLQLDLKPVTLSATAGPRWQARFQLSNVDTDRFGLDSMRLGNRVLSVNMLGDYYLTSSGLSGVRGGLRATGGMLLGPLSLTQTSSGLALGNSGNRSLNFGLRSFGTPDTSEPSASMSYLGIGYTGHALHSGLSFSADLGLMTNTALSGLRLGQTPVQLDDVLRDMRYKPLLQLGLSYSY
ncbi:hypothetical protein ACFJGW_09445 [Burkholderiaceae bacterium UC74_6]